MNIASIDIDYLTESERIELTEELWDSVALNVERRGQLIDAQLQELNRRSRKHEADPGSSIP